MPAESLGATGQAKISAKSYGDYRKLLDDAAAFDAVVIGTPDHWHAPLCKAFMNAGKHVYCEKPLTHSVAEARELRELTRRGKVVTQMGNQGSASASMRRCTELVKAGVLGQVREIHHWGIGVAASEGNCAGRGSDSKGLQLGPLGRAVGHAPFQQGLPSPTLAHVVGFWQRRSGRLLVPCLQYAHAVLYVGYPERLVVNLKDGHQIADKPAVEFHFPARGDLPPLVLYWHGDGQPPAALIQPVADVGKVKSGGILVVGEHGCMYTGHWNNEGMIRLAGESRLKDVLYHPATKDIPQTLPRVTGHYQEFVDACRGKGKTFSDFEIGGKLTEIGLAGCVAVRAGKDLDWDGEKMLASNAPETARIVHSVYRKNWL